MRLRLQTTWTSTVVGDIYLDHFPVTVGRGNECDICLPVGFISRRHCRFIHRDGEVLLLDLESLNGTYVNGQPANLMMPIQHGDEVRFGPLSFRVVILSGHDLGTLHFGSTPSEMTMC
jgi:pSer/pThr/pTyr-binding forkhead associated (FHA) protein